MAVFDSTLKPKLIYVFAIADDKHSGCLKIGEATMSDCTNLTPLPNSRELNQAAKARIDQYTKTAGIDYQLLYTESTLFVDAKKKSVTSFNDKQVHQVLERSGVQKADFKNQGTEWFRTDLETVKRAIAAVKEGRQSLTASEVTQGQNPIIFRPEQREAIDKTVKKFKHSNRMLWNAKMRFGKTISALQVVKEMQFTRTLILTHRPVVNEGWYKDFQKIFYDSPDYEYGSKTNGNDLTTMEFDASMGTMKYVYFASMQDLRGSGMVGGKFDKNEAVFHTNWDLIIVDEAHEGTQTQLGQSVMEELSKQNSKVLKLSGTPFNLIDEYKEDEVFTWDYTMEQTAKAQWDESFFGDPNPYAGLPTMNIYTYDLGKLMSNYIDADVAFNFAEFLRVKDDGTFVHEKDVNHFLDLLTKEDKDSCYPFANQEYRDNFKHTLWMVTGVKAAKALSTLLNNHRVFQYFKVVNVAGDGDEEIDTRDALKSVQDAIKNNEYTITISCGRLTTGVTVPEWTAVLMISGSFNTAASSYMQTIFRVQTPATINGKTKEQCFVFDFAPDRTLKVIAETAKVSAKAGKTTENDRETLGKFLNFCPIISYDGSQMRDKITADKLFAQSKKVYVERVVRSGFEDNSLYSDELLKMNDLDLDDFNELKKKIGTTKAMPKTGDIDINDQGLTNEEYERKEQLEKKKRKRELSEEEQKELDLLNRAKKNRATAISILRGISIRMPLLIYGAELKEGNGDVTIDNFASLIDDTSWEEFMPRGVTKIVFSHFRKYYDRDIFVESGRRIRALAESADNMTVEQRIARITRIFDTFRNPDKETVLTPWRVVNMHLGDCLGGYNFYNEDYTQPLDEPRYVEREKVTESVFNPNTHILEINSKSGLYPLYAAYSIYRSKINTSLFSTETIEDQRRLWDEVVRDNIFVICKTKMAQSITKRTLIGFRQAKTNTHAFDDLNNQITNKQTELIEKINKGQLFRNFKNMKFNAIVGNPPYQDIKATEKAGINSAFASAIYPQFIELARKLNPQYISLITPSRWMTKTGQGVSDEWVDSVIKGNHFICINDYYDALDVFNGVEIKGGINYFLYGNDYVGMCRYTMHQNGLTTTSTDYLDASGAGIVIRDSFARTIIQKVQDIESNYQSTNNFSVLVSPQHFFDKDGLLTTSWKGYSKERNDLFNIKYYVSQQVENIGYGWIKESDIPKNKEVLPLHKIFLSKAYNGGDSFPHQIIGKPLYGEPYSLCSQTYLVIGYDYKKNTYTKEECFNVMSYMKTRFFRFMVFIKKKTQDNPSSVFQFVPLQDFSKPWTDDELYKKYNLSDEEIAYIESMIKPME